MASTVSNGNDRLRKGNKPWRVHAQVFFLHVDYARQNRDFARQMKISALDILKKTAVI